MILQSVTEQILNTLSEYGFLRVCGGFQKCDQIKSEVKILIKDETPKKDNYVAKI